MSVPRLWQGSWLLFKVSIGRITESLAILESILSDEVSDMAIGSNDLLACRFNGTVPFVMDGVWLAHSIQLQFESY